MDNPHSLDVTSTMAFVPGPMGGTSFHILIPVGSHKDHEHELTYAAQVAATQNGHIHLYHITDVMELPEFENPFAVRRWLREVRTEASSRLKSFTTAIEQLGAKVFSSESSVGQTSFLLQQKVQDLIPDLIIVGEGSLRSQTLSKLTKKAPCPVLIVPKKVHNSMIYVGVRKRRTKIDSLDLLYRSVEKWSLN